MNNKLSWGQEFILELSGTFVLILFGCGVVAMTTIFKTDADSIVMGGYTNVTLGWGFAVMMGIYVSNPSGAHINPAVTLGYASIGKFPWSKVPHYIIAQLIGAFLGAAVVFAVYYFKWIEYDPYLDHTANVFATFPAVPGFLPGFIDQVVGTAILLFMILAISNKSNDTGKLSPILVGFIIMAIGISLGGMHGYAINPARDFGPRLFTLVAGFKNTGFESSVWIVPVLGSIAGGILGSVLYKIILDKIDIQQNIK